MTVNKVNPVNKVNKVNLLPQPVLEPDPASGMYRLYLPYHLFVDTGPDAGLLITIDAGFLTDGQSIPSPLWGLCGHPFDAGMIAEAVIHDALTASEYFRRLWVDNFFRWTMQAGLQPELKTWLWYRAVRIGGHRVWENHTETSVCAARKLVRVSRNGQYLEPHSRLTPWDRVFPRAT